MDHLKTPLRVDNAQLSRDFFAERREVDFALNVTGANAHENILREVGSGYRSNKLLSRTESSRLCQPNERRV
jgi:hypothetical protein